MAIEGEKVVATFTVKDASRKTPEGRRLIAEWLRHCAKALVKDGHNYMPRFRARYLSLKTDA